MELTEEDRKMLEKLVEDKDDKEENDSDKYQT